MPTRYTFGSHRVACGCTVWFALTAAVWLPSAAGEVPPIVFRTPPAFPVGSGPWQVVSSDFNRDGTFNSKVDIDTWEIPWNIAAADVNHDGRPDLIAAHYDWRRISVMINLTTNNGPVSFAPPLTHHVANDPVCVTTADFNGDNVLDIASGNFASVSVLLGEGDGTFTTATNYWVGGSWVSAGDFNHDGMIDLVIDLGSKVGMFWNDTLPRLQISAASAGVRVAYPAWEPYQLEVDAGPMDAGAWQAVTTTPTRFGSQYVITSEFPGAVHTFRLSRPAP